MPRIRTVKPEIWNSRDFMALSTVGQLAFIALITLADDEGRLECDAAWLRATCLRDVRASTVRAQLARAAALGMLTEYTVEHKPYIQLTNWSKHQRVDKPRPSSIPPPPSRTFANDRDTSQTPREPSIPRARPRIGSDRTGEDQGSTPKATSGDSTRAGRAEVLTNPTDHPDALAYAARWMERRGLPPSPADREFFNRVPYECPRLGRSAILQAIDDLFAKWEGKGRYPPAKYLAGQLSDLEAAASDAGATTRARSPNGGLTRISAVPLIAPDRQDPDDE